MLGTALALVPVLKTFGGGSKDDNEERTPCGCWEQAYRQREGVGGENSSREGGLEERRPARWENNSFIPPGGRGETADKEAV